MHQARGFTGSLLSWHLIGGAASGRPHVFRPGLCQLRATYVHEAHFSAAVGVLPAECRGDWKWGLALTTLVYPLIAYAFVAASDRLHEWAAVPGGSGDYAVVVRRLGDGFLT